MSSEPLVGPVWPNRTSARHQRWNERDPERMARRRPPRPAGAPLALTDMALALKVMWPSDFGLTYAQRLMVREIYRHELNRERAGRRGPLLGSEYRDYMERTFAIHGRPDYYGSSPPPLMYKEFEMFKRIKRTYG